MKNTLLKFAGLAVTLLLCSYGFAQKKTFIRDYIYQASEADSKLTARAVATQQMQILLLQEIGQALQSEQTLKKLSVARDGKETFSESFSQEVMAITAGFVEMKILNESWNGKTYYIEAQMTVDPKDVSQRVADALSNKQKGNAVEAKAAPAGTEAERRVRELEAQKREIELKKELARLKEIEDKEQARLEKKLARQAFFAKPEWYEPNAAEVGLEFGNGIEFDVMYTRYISPNFGFDILKLSFASADHADAYFLFLTGLRFATNRFGRTRNKYFYSSVRAGVEYGIYDYGRTGSSYTYSGLAFAAELEVGIRFNKYFSLGAVVNQGFFKTKLKDNSDYYFISKQQPPRISDRTPFIGLRVGFDFCGGLH